MSHETDLRIRRTQKMLQDTFIQLVVEVGFESVTVQLLSERAMVNRATFYRHYEDKYDLAEKVYSAITDDYRASVQVLSINNPLEGWRMLFEHCALYADFYLSLFHGWPQFPERVRRGIEEEILAFSANESIERPLDLTKHEVPTNYESGLPLNLTLRYLATAQMGIMEWWLDNNQPVPPAQMAEYLWRLHSQGPFAQLPNLSTQLEKP
ncbi:MAG: TetR/AcrR family transcriptional regulator [Chloroflexota bacterium]